MIKEVSRHGVVELASLGRTNTFKVNEKIV